MDIQIKRIYEDVSKNDGFRVLVDRVWPRGKSKNDAKLDEWMKEIAPSTELRKWFNHKEDRFPQFSEKYIAELKTHPELITKLVKEGEKNKITLLYGAKDEKYNQAVVLKKFIETKQ